MTDIYIKSFNRPFYLDRCLQSIHQKVKGEINVVILDDGTPQKYLDRIQVKYPHAEIRKSNPYLTKAKAIEENIVEGTDIDGFEIPTDLWIDAARSASDYFIMTEDDVWLTEDINLDELVSACKKFDIKLLKLGWLGNKNDDKYLNINGLTSNINTAIPEKLFLSSEKIMEAFFYNRYKFFTILYKFGLVNNKTRQKYWALNSILMGLYHKEYWLQIWKNMNGKVDEKRQLINASVYYRKHLHNPNFVSRIKKETLKTTFQSSATNSYHPYGTDFDVNQFNYQINEAWYEGTFDAFHNFPHDFPTDYFCEFLDQKIDKNEYRTWAEKFKDQYRNLGCDVE